MSRLLDIRTKVLRITQVQMAQISGASQATVSRWESGELEPDRQQLASIRTAVLDRGLDWDDRWFFEAPSAEPSEAAA